MLMNHGWNFPQGKQGMSLASGQMLRWASTSIGVISAGIAWLHDGPWDHSSVDFYHLLILPWRMSAAGPQMSL